MITPDPYEDECMACVDLSPLPEAFRLEAARALREDTDEDALEALALEIDGLGFPLVGRRFHHRALFFRGRHGRHHRRL